MSNPIEDYALIGDGETAALVSRSGSVHWLCWPRFDSDACFAALLGAPEHGCWQISPTAPVRAISRRYQEDTLVLETDLETADGIVRLIDFMPERGTSSSVVRIVVGLHGNVAMRSEVRMRFDYGSSPPWCEAAEEGAVARLGPNLVVLRAPVAVSVHESCQRSKFTVALGTRLAFVLSHVSSDKPVPAPFDADEALAATQAYWRAAGSAASTMARRSGPAR